MWNQEAVKGGTGHLRGGGWGAKRDCGLGSNVIYSLNHVPTAKAGSYRGQGFGDGPAVPSCQSESIPAFKGDLLLKLPLAF